MTKAKNTQKQSTDQINQTDRDETSAQFEIVTLPTSDGVITVDESVRSGLDNAIANTSASTTDAQTGDNVS